MVANVPDSTNRCRAQSGFIARIRGSDVRIGVICDEFGTFTQSPLYRQHPDLGETSGHVSFVPRTDVSGTELSAGSPSFDVTKGLRPGVQRIHLAQLRPALCRPDVIFINWISDGRQGMHTAFMEVGRRCAIDGQTEKFRSTVVAARVHQLLASID
jgi:hypothetical protein